MAGNREIGLRDQLCERLRAAMSDDGLVMFEWQR